MCFCGGSQYEHLNVYIHVFQSNHGIHSKCFVIDFEGKNRKDITYLHMFCCYYDILPNLCK